MEPERVNALGTALGMSEEAVRDQAVALQRERLIQFEWGGKVALTERGRQLLRGTQAAVSIHLEKNATISVVGDNSQMSGVVGAGARAAIATGAGATAHAGNTIGVQPGDLLAALV